MSPSSTRRWVELFVEPEKPPAQDEGEPIPARAHVKEPLPDLLHENLPAVLLAKHRELDRLLNELTDISNALKSHASPDIQNLGGSLLRAVRGAIRQSLLDKELCSLALSDDLTGLQNRRGFLALAGQQLKQAHRSGQHVLLFSCDLNNLKTINDSYGHQEGDHAIVRTAEALKQTFRNSDILARFGGDEFWVLAFEASVQHEESILERLKENLRRASALEPRYSLSLSMGLARFDPRRPLSLQDLMAEADNAMYQQKKAIRGTHRVQALVDNESGRCDAKPGQT
jgi:diguanylate cyclase (GGDEF)-like protein